MKQTRSSPAQQYVRPTIRYRFARRVALLAGWASRRMGHGATSLPGNVLLRIEPQALRYLAHRTTAPSTIMVSATNGKTTVCAMLATIFEQQQLRVVHNMSGANLRSGIATTLLYAPRTCDVILLETDEATLARVAPEVAPTVIVLGNLFRDQLDRYGELDAIATRWRSMFSAIDPSRTSVVFNADDPLIADIVHSWTHQDGTSTAPFRTLACGMDDPSAGRSMLSHAADSKFCPRCAAPLTYTTSWIGHLGDWSCTNCGNARPNRAVSITSVELDGLASSRMVVHLPAGAVVDSDTHAADFSVQIRIPGLYNVYNALAAVATACALGVPATAISSGLARFSPAFGRFERIPVPGTGTITLLLVKNPTGLNEVVRTLVGAQIDLTSLAFALNDGIADGRDTSWIWDADLEPLIAAATSGMIATGDRAAEFALRAIYGGADPASITVIDDVEEALFALLERGRSLTQHGHCYALVTYTAMLRMRDVITRQGWAQAFWERKDEQLGAVGAGTGVPS